MENFKKPQNCIKNGEREWKINGRIQAQIFQIRKRDEQMLLAYRRQVFSRNVLLIIY